MPISLLYALFRKKAYNLFGMDSELKTISFS